MTQDTNRTDEVSRREGVSDDPFTGPDPFGEFAPAYRPLLVYAFDPGRGRRGGNHLMLRVPFEPLQPGPIGSRVAVVDEDRNGRRLHPPLDLNDPDVRLHGGLEPSESNPQFHQQMVYAVISHLLRTFDRALGRQVRFRTAGAATPVPLTVLPHGIPDETAFYENSRCALSFGQFRAKSSVGRIIGGQSIYTCLSHSVIVHETTHALLDGLRPEFWNEARLETAAFHEGIADTIALLHQSTFQETLMEPVQRTGGRLYSASFQPELDGLPGGSQVELNPLIALGEQFADAIGLRGGIRSAVATPQGKKTKGSKSTPHARGTVMVHAIFDAFFHVYARRTRGLFRLCIWRPGADGGLHPDLVGRLAAEAAQLASSLLRLCIRAIVYCPASLISLGDYLRAMITVHARLDPDDRDGFRDALIDAFARRGIYPPGVASMSESELLWERPADDLTLPLTVIRALRAADAAGVRDAEAERQLQEFCHQHREPLGLIPDAPIEIIPFYQAIRFVGAELDIAEELVCQVKPVQGSATTLIFGDDRRVGRLRYAINKRTLS